MSEIEDEEVRIEIVDPEEKDEHKKEPPDPDFGELDVRWTIGKAIPGDLLTDEDEKESEERKDRKEKDKEDKKEKEE